MPKPHEAVILGLECKIGDSQSTLCRFGIDHEGVLPDQFANQLVRFGEGGRGVWPSKINTSPPAKPHNIAHGDVSGVDQSQCLERVNPSRGEGVPRFDSSLLMRHWKEGERGLKISSKTKRATLVECGLQLGKSCFVLELIFPPSPQESAILVSDCKSVYAGSIPTSASTIRKPRRLTSAGFFFVV